MIEISLLVGLGVAAAAFTIGFAKAGVGGSMGSLVTVLAVLVLPARVALGFLLPLLILGDILALSALWGRWNLGLAARLLPGSVLGVAGGSMLLSFVSVSVLARLVGALTLVFVVYWIIEPQLTRRTQYTDRIWHGRLAGLTAGVTSTLAHSGGPPVSMYLLLRRTPPVEFVASSAVVFAALNLLKIPGYLAAGLFEAELQFRLLWTAALVPVGVAVGRVMVTRINTRQFHVVTVLLLALSGSYLILRG